MQQAGCFPSIHVKHNVNLCASSTLTLQGVEKSVVARHEVGHALVATGARLFYFLGWLLVVSTAWSWWCCHFAAKRHSCASEGGAYSAELGRHRSWAVVAAGHMCLT